MERYMMCTYCTSTAQSSRPKTTTTTTRVASNSDHVRLCDRGDVKRILLYVASRTGDPMAYEIKTSGVMPMVYEVVARSRQILPVGDSSVE